MSEQFLDMIRPHWPVPPHVKAFVTTREQGPSQGAYAHFNPADHVGDDPKYVNACRQRLMGETNERPLNWLNQVHGTRVAHTFEPGQEADAAVAFDSDYACVVMTADCLPVFFADQEGSRVGVAHAGWRGLAAGVLENTVAALECEPAEVIAWLGPAIGPRVYEVGCEVRDAFVHYDPAAASAIVPSPYRLKHYMIDLYRLAQLRLESIGVVQVFGGGFCTASDETRFYSFRRDGANTGRMASVIWLEH